MSAHKHNHEYVAPVVAKQEDGSIELNFTIEWETIKSEMEHVASHLGEGLKIPGFREGKAPIEAIMANIPKDKLITETIGHILPHYLTEAYKENQIIPIMYPKVSLVSADEGKPWEIKVITAQMPEVKLGDYKKEIKAKIDSKSLWKPGEDKDKKELSREEKESIALKTLLEETEITIPSVLVQEEADQRLSQLLARLEKLGLSLENYLNSQGKRPEDIRAEYALQAQESLKIELLLSKIAEKEKISVSEEDIKSFSEALALDPKRVNKELTEDEKRSVVNILIKRKTIDFLVS